MPKPIEKGLSYKNNLGLGGKKKVFAPKVTKKKKKSFTEALNDSSSG
jgi:hypothetical protein